MAKKAIPLPILTEEPEEQQCPECPPKGAPAWMATFADMATLLMAFFVLILSFAEFNQPKFKLIAGSLKDAFGVQRLVPVVEQPKGTTLLDMSFSPSPDPSVTKDITQETTEREQPELETKNSEADGDEGQSELADALAEALESGDLKAEMRDGEVVLTFPEQGGDSPQGAGDLAEQLTQAADALDQAAAETGSSTEDVLIGGLSDRLRELADESEGGSEGPGGNPDGDGTGSAGGGTEKTAMRAASRLAVALRNEIGEGLVSMETRDGKVFVTVGAGGAFPSGSADLTQEARDIMERISYNAITDAGKITVTGHTDNVPLNPTSPMRDNWGLAAARATSVVREIGSSGLIDMNRLSAVSMGEAAPVASNDTSAGREQNRRIEIEIAY